MSIPESSLKMVDGDASHSSTDAKQRNEPNQDLDAINGTKTFSSDSGSGKNSLSKRRRPWFKSVNPLRWGAIPPVPEEPAVSLEHTASLWSKLTFQWVTPLMRTGYMRQLQEVDIWKINPDRGVESLIHKVKSNAHASNNDRPLFGALHQSFRQEIWLGGACALLYSILQTVTPFVLRYLIQAATDAYNAKHNHDSQRAPPISHGIGLAVGITLMQMVQCFCFSHFIYLGMMLGGQSRSVLVGMIYEKAMRISSRARAGTEAEVAGGDAFWQNQDSLTNANVRNNKSEKQGLGDGSAGDNSVVKSHLGWDNGRITNLMSVDAFRIDQACALLHLAWATPIASCITVALLIVNLGYSALTGCALLLVGIILLVRAVSTLATRRQAVNTVTEKRIGLLREIIPSVRFIKYFGWGSAFLDRLDRYRTDETSAIKGLQMVRNAITAGSASLPVYASLLAFVTYSLTNHALSPARVFSSLALFNSLATPLYILPPIIGQVVDAWASLKRIDEFLSAEEAAEESITNIHSERGLEINHATFTWETAKSTSESDDNAEVEPDNSVADVKEKGLDSDIRSRTNSEPFKLKDIDFTAGTHELIAVVGTVGCGKSSLLSAAAGEMRMLDGDVVLGGRRAFCPQQAWIQNATLKENIVFGQPWDADKYQRIVEACCLQPDFDILPDRDETQTGERGVSLSGGQKQRINIARAIYFGADLVLLDDPLSAVDAHVGRHIFHHAFLGLLKDKCRILATHQPWVLPYCDRIIWIDEGKIKADDTLENLLVQYPDYGLFSEKKRDPANEENAENEDGEMRADIEGDVTDATKTSEARHLDDRTNLMLEEERGEASLPWSLYAAYIRASGSIFNGLWVLLLLTLYQGCSIVASLWLSFWTSDRFNLHTGVYIGVYATLATVEAVITFIFATLVSVFGVRASKTLLAQAAKSVLGAPMSFFDSTPMGRILNRFSTDVDYCDNYLPEGLRMWMSEVAVVIAVLILIIAYYHYFAIAVVPFALLYVVSAMYYRASAREVKRYEAVLRSSTYAKFSEGLTGVASIKAYGLADSFVVQLYGAIDRMSGAYYLTFGNQRWVSLRLDMVGNLMVLIVGILAVTSRFQIHPATTGLVLSYTVAVVQNLQFSVRRLAEVENGMNAVERLHYYITALEQEGSKQNDTAAVRETWPEKGEIVFDKVSMQYRSDLPVILHDLSLRIRSGERLGIVGRTGAGKSSIMVALFRLTEVSKGAINIDGVDVSTVGLETLRPRLSIVPQDPTLFRGTIRSNLDPFNEYTDLELWSALREVELVPNSTTGPSSSSGASSGATNDYSSAHLGLDSTVEEDGANYSLGQRQLIALARALMRGTQIMVCDEATSSLDMATDARVQRALLKASRGKTLLCIAHRLRTVIGYDRICVMDAGRVSQLGSPLDLFSEEGGIFRGMCESNGIALVDVQEAQHLTAGI